MKILICGDRNWTDYRKIYRVVQEFPADTIVIHGDCRGADKLAGRAASKLGLSVTAFPANWEKHGKAAGHIRNAQMLDESPDIVIAFHNDLDSSRGTRDMLSKAEAAGLPCVLYHKEGIDMNISATISILGMYADSGFASFTVQENELTH
jgi:hypothetical protein